MGREIYTYLRDDEYQQFMAAFEKSLYRKISAYSRNLLLGKPVKVIHRNRSLDDFIEMGVGLRKDLRRVLSMEIFSSTELQELKSKIISIEEQLIKLVEICKQK